MIIKNRKKRFTRSTILTLSLVLILLISALGYFLNFQAHKNDEAKNLQKNRDEAQTQSAKKNDANNNPGSKEIPSTNSTSQDVEITNAVTLNVDSFSQSGGNVDVSALIAGASKNGICVFLFTSAEDKPVTREVASAVNDQRNLCSVSIPEVEFNKLGTWKLNVTFYVGNQKSEVNKDVTIS